MTAQDPFRLYGYLVQNIVGVLVSPTWNIYEAAAVLPNDANSSQAVHIWQTVVLRVAQFCAKTEPYRTGREQVDLVLLRIHEEAFPIISSRVLTARMRQAPERV